jgi:TfoX/Sxy family transcriptional regulator of competence genes
LTETNGTDEAQALLDRIAPLLPAGVQRKVRMFGAIAVLVDDAMIVAVRKDGSLLVRVNPAEDAHLLEDPGASRAEMGRGRPMSEGWIRVERSGLRREAALQGWIDAATRRFAADRRR